MIQTSHLSALKFARLSLRDGIKLAPTGDLRITPAWTELILFRAGNYQIELVILSPNQKVPPHRHLRCEGADVSLAGSGAFSIESRQFNFLLSSGLHGVRPHLVRRNEVHGGEAGPNGAAYLSFQEWIGTPGYIADDWEAV